RATDLEAQAQVFGANGFVLDQVKTRMSVAVVRREDDDRQDRAFLLGAEEQGGGEVRVVLEKADAQVARGSGSPPISQQGPAPTPEVPPADGADGQAGMQPGSAS